MSKNTYPLPLESKTENAGGQTLKEFLNSIAVLAVVLFLGFFGFGGLLLIVYYLSGGRF